MVTGRVYQFMHSVLQCSSLESLSCVVKSQRAALLISTAAHMPIVRRPAAKAAVLQFKTLASTFSTETVKDMQQRMFCVLF